MTPSALTDMLSDGRLGAASGRPFRGATPQPVHASCGYPALPTGVPEIDAVLPRGGLKAGATHEWFAPPLGPENGRGPWYPPLTLMAYLAARAEGREPGAPAGLLVWVGRRCWPMPA